MAAQTTSVTIDGTKTDLVFGARYRLRYGRDAKILEDAVLERRAPNGDLLFGVAGQVSRVRVRPSTIDAIYGSGTESLDYADQRIDGFEPESLVCDACGATYAGTFADHNLCPSEPETFGPVDSPLRDELARQAETDALVESFVSDGDHDPDSVAAKVETELRRRAEPMVSIVSARGELESAAAYLARLERPVPKGLGAAYIRWLETDPGQRALEDAARETNAARVVQTKKAIVRKGLADILAGTATAADVLEAIRPTQIVVDGTVVAETRKIDAAAEIVAFAASVPVAKPSGAKPYSERNHIWKCPTCKHRTRQPECSNGHAAVSAPAGKRAAERIAR